jgi:hypothetical protein
VIFVDESIRGRILRCTNGTADSGSEVSPTEFGTGDSLICIESCDRLRLAEDGGNLNSPAAPEGDGRTDSSEGLSIVAFLWPSGVVRSATNILEIVQKIQESRLATYERCNLVLRSPRIEFVRSPRVRRQYPAVFLTVKV